MLQPNIEKLDCVVRVITPENVEFEYVVAGPFQRAMAFVFDFLVRIGAMLALLMLMGIGASFVPFASALTTVAIILAYFVMSWFYGVYFESRFNGRTLGKMLFRLRVISTDGRPINGVQAALRNLLRLADMYPSPLTGLLSMMMTNRFQRIGDLAAGTMVIVDRVRQAPWDLQPDDPRAFGLAELIPASFVANSTMTQTVGMYMENRRKLPMSRRLEVAKHLSAPLIKKFEMLPDTSPDLLLCALFVRIFMSEQQQSAGREQMRTAGARRASGVGGTFGGGLRVPNASLGSNSTALVNAQASSQVNTAASSAAGSTVAVPSTQEQQVAGSANLVGGSVDNVDDDLVEIVAEVVERDVPRSAEAGQSKTEETN